MEFKKKPQSSVPVLQRPPQIVQAAQPAPAVQRQALIQRDLQRHTLRPTTVQRQVAAPALKAAALHTAEVQRLSAEQTSIQRQAAEIDLPQTAIDAALQRQQAAPAPVPTKPQSIGDWVTVMRFQAEQSEGRRMGAKEAAQFTALQRQVAQTMSRSYLTDRQSAVQRQQDYAGHVVALQRHPVSGQVARAFMLSVPQGERAALQRAVDEVSQQEALQRQQDEQALKLHTLQRQLAELNEQATRPVFERIQQRRGAGNPLPEAIQRHLEQGLNHDLSAVRIHDDAEADKLAKGVNAIAFTTGTDIYFQSGKFNPNSQSGLELLAHEVTHTVQQSKGQVGKGVDPDSRLESEARQVGRKLSVIKPVGQDRNSKARPAVQSVSSGLAVQRQYETPLVFANSQSHTSFFVSGEGKAWDDAKAAVGLALQMVPGKFGQQFKGMPQALLQGLVSMARDITLTLSVSTAVGAVIGAFFGGVGAAPGAALGFEVGNLILTAWGLGVLIPAVKGQLDSMGWSIRQFSKLSKEANGDPKKVKQAAETLSNGIVIFCNGLLLALGALLLKKGADWLINSKLGAVIGAKTASSPSLNWLKQRQQLASAKPVVKALVERGQALGRSRLQSENGLLSKGLKMASAAVKGIDRPTDPALLQQAIKVGTLKYHLHPRFAEVKAELSRYGFELREAKETHVIYRRLLDPKDKKAVIGYEKILNLQPDVRFIDVLHEMDHIRQLMVNLKGEVFTDTGVARQSGGGFKSFGNDPLYRSSTLSDAQNKVTEVHVRLKEYLRLKAAGADDALLAEHYVGVTQWLKEFRDATSASKGSASNAILQDWAYTTFPDLQKLIEEFQAMMTRDGSGIRLR